MTSVTTTNSTPPGGPPAVGTTGAMTGTATGGTAARPPPRHCKATSPLDPIPLPTPQQPLLQMHRAPTPLQQQTFQQTRLLQSPLRPTLATSLLRKTPLTPTPPHRRETLQRRQTSSCHPNQPPSPARSMQLANSFPLPTCSQKQHASTPCTQRCSTRTRSHRTNEPWPCVHNQGHYPS